MKYDTMVGYVLEGTFIREGVFLVSKEFLFYLVFMLGYKHANVNHPRL